MTATLTKPDTPVGSNIWFGQPIVCPCTDTDYEHHHTFKEKRPFQGGRFLAVSLDGDSLTLEGPAVGETEPRMFSVPATTKYIVCAR